MSIRTIRDSVIEIMVHHVEALEHDVLLFFALFFKASRAFLETLETLVHSLYNQNSSPYICPEKIERVYIKYRITDVLKFLKFLS